MGRMGFRSKVFLDLTGISGWDREGWDSPRMGLWEGCMDMFLYKYDNSLLGKDGIVFKPCLWDMGSFLG